MIAQVIVDVAAKQTDKVFEYHVPDQLNDVEIGSRVFVPFGPRKLQGFVVGLSENSDFNGKLKDLLVVVDEMPPLTPELISLSQSLAQKIFSYRISILKTMLPRVMRANYRKILIPISQSAKELPLFQGDPVDLNRITDVEQIALARKLLRETQAEVEYLVENRAKKKTEKSYSLTKKITEYQQIKEGIRANAVNQQKLLTDIISNYKEYPKRQAELKIISSATLKTAVRKGWLNEKTS